MIRFISNKLIASPDNQSRSKNTGTYNPVKLRLLSNKYYRFGYDEGLAIIFDE